MIEQTTTIKVSVKLRDQLKKLKTHPRETIGDVIARLIHEYREV